MGDRPNAVFMQSNPLTLTGDEPQLGAKAPDFTALATDLSAKSLSDYTGKVIIISSVPSLDTPVCELQTKRFNTEAEKLGENVVILTLSMDLPFAQARWCGAQGVEKLVTLSDHKDASFGQNYGLLIKELRLLARAVLIIDQNGMLVYRQLVQEISQEPDYEKVMEALKKVF
ncbi:thiol peroxidase [Dethiosulfatarculus sandiegensis]|uniref:Thiol peroxidase n=1 Tax=Dethiosulfatarculus sandiegensis TaxID=1429043 RepID=A0A0D2JJV0_9BACT|nr:thiol peroxidase [Dethiosulfatarculus sandiegensis]KIX15916.1 lipid hydroperoxide peroxidase [Dethiosulfatarculus sandiegensis]